MPFFTGLYIISIGLNLIRCFLMYSVVTKSKPLNFCVMQLQTFLFFVFYLSLLFFSAVVNFFFASNTLKKYPCSIRALFFSKHCSSNLWWSNFSWSLSFKPNNFSCNYVPISSWKLLHWSTFSVFSWRIAWQIAQKNASIDPTLWGIIKVFSKSLTLFSWLQMVAVSGNSSAKSDLKNL